MKIPLQYRVSGPFQRKGPIKDRRAFKALRLPARLEGALIMRDPEGVPNPARDTPAGAISNNPAGARAPDRRCCYLRAPETGARKHAQVT